jgi:hypothetical protein
MAGILVSEPVMMLRTVKPSDAVVSGTIRLWCFCGGRGVGEETASMVCFRKQL